MSSGLSPGELVISEGMHKVQHGQSITPLNEQEYKQRKEAEEKKRAQAEQQLVEE